MGNQPGAEHRIEHLVQVVDEPIGYRIDHSIVLVMWNGAIEPVVLADDGEFVDAEHSPRTGPGFGFVIDGEALAHDSGFFRQRGPVLDGASVRQELFILLKATESTNGSERSGAALFEHRPVDGQMDRRSVLHSDLDDRVLDLDPVRHRFV